MLIADFYYLTYKIEYIIVEQNKTLNKKYSNLLFPFSNNKKRTASKAIVTETLICIGRYELNIISTYKNWYDVKKVHITTKLVIIADIIVITFIIFFIFNHLSYFQILPLK